MNQSQTAAPAQGSAGIDSARKLFQAYGITIVIAVIVAFLIRFFVVEAYRIPSANMRPTLEPGDTVFAIKWTYGLRFPWNETPLLQGRSPSYGDVVVYTQTDAKTESKVDSIKRVVGLAGDSFEMQKGKVILNGKPLTLPGASHSICGQEKLPLKEYGVCWEPPIMDDHAQDKVPVGSVLVMGDLRSQLTDPRKGKNWSVIPASAIKGEVLWVWLSVEPQSPNPRATLFSRIKFERMFQRIK